MSLNYIRSTIRHGSNVLESVRRSLQTCCLSQNWNVLLNIKETTNDPVRRKNIDCLLFILQLLLADVPNSNGKAYTQSYIQFDEAYDIYLAFSELGEHA